MQRRLLPIALILATLTVGPGGCGDDPTGGCVCTDEFRLFSVAVVDQTGQPVSDLEVTVMNLRTGRQLVSGWLGLLAPGSYVVADDGMRDEFSVGGDRVRVTGTSPGASFSAEYLFSTDACRCHVRRDAGPDIVVID